MDEIPPSNSNPTPSPHAIWAGATPPPAARRRISPLALVLGLSAAFFVIFLLVSGAMFLMHGGSSGSSSSSHGGSHAIFGSSSGAVGVVELSGVIMDSKKTIARLKHFDEDDGIRAVVLRLDSPGGSVAPSQEIYQAVREFKKPLVVSMASVAASGAFYVACGAKKVFANPGTITGSIGVIMEMVDLEKLYDWAKIKRYSIKTGKYKDAGAEYRDLQPDERALLQGMIDNVLGQFKTAVSKGRKLPMDAVTAIADGRVWSGEQAKAAKLVDELGTLQDAIDEAGREGGIKGKPEVVYPEGKKHRLLDLLLDNGGSGDDDDSSTAETGGAAASAPGGALMSAFQAFADALLGRHVTRPALDAMPGLYWIWNGPR